MDKPHYHSPLLAGFNKNGKPWVNSVIKQQLGANTYNRIMRHQRAFYRAMKEGKSWTEARRIALKAEHKGMTKLEREEYEGRIGALAEKLKRK